MHNISFKIPSKCGVCIRRHAAHYDACTPDPGPDCAAALLRQKRRLVSQPRGMPNMINDYNTPGGPRTLRYI